jgi:hypothetical protein
VNRHEDIPGDVEAADDREKRGAPAERGSVRGVWVDEDGKWWEKRLGEVTGRQPRRGLGSVCARWLRGGAGVTMC